ncbi:chemotactic signal-response protein CheL [compost metagenome]
METSALGLGPQADRTYNPVRATKKPAKPDSPEQQKLMKACREFESVMLGQVLKQMRSSVQSSDPLNQGAANDTFRSMLDDETAKNMAKGGGIGLAESIYRQLSLGVE